MGKIRELVPAYRTRNDYQVGQGETILKPEDVARIFGDALRAKPWECFVAVYLNGANRIIAWSEITTGTPSQAVPHIRNVIAPALLKFATAIIVLHNHPSDSDKPSVDDRRFTHGLKVACDAMDIELLDHILIFERPEGGTGFYSFAEGEGL